MTVDNPEKLWDDGRKGKAQPGQDGRKVGADNGIDHVR